MSFYLIALTSAMQRLDHDTDELRPRSRRIKKQQQLNPRPRAMRMCNEGVGSKEITETLAVQTLIVIYSISTPYWSKKLSGESEMPPGLVLDWFWFMPWRSAFKMWPKMAPTHPQRNLFGPPFGATSPRYGLQNRTKTATGGNHKCLRKLILTMRSVDACILEFVAAVAAVYCRAKQHPHARRSVYSLAPDGCHYH